MFQTSWLHSDNCKFYRNFILCKQSSDQLTADEISLKFETSVLLYCHPVFEVQGQLMFGSLTKISVKAISHTHRNRTETEPKPNRKNKMPYTL